MALTLEEAFREDIVTNPNDDAPRLIYADWLDDQGDSDRAEFIRVQIERRRLPEGDPRQDSLRRRELTLAQQGESFWRSALPTIPGVSWEDFSSGFVEGVFVSSTDVLLREWEAVFQAAPVRRLQIADVDAIDAANLASLEKLSQLTELNLGNNPGLGADGVGALARSPYLCHLKSLLLHHNSLGDEAMDGLVTSPYLAGLEELYLSGNALTDEGVRILASGRYWASLTDLDLRDNRIADSGAAALGRSTCFPILTTLYLVNNSIRTFGASTIAWSESLPRLGRLYLNYNPVGNDGVVAFANSSARHALRDLDLRHAEIRDTGARALARSETLLGLELLWLTGNLFSREALKLLRERFGDRLRV